VNELNSQEVKIVNQALLNKLTGDDSARSEGIVAVSDFLRTVAHEDKLELPSSDITIHDGSDDLLAEVFGICVYRFDCVGEADVRQALKQRLVKYNRDKAGNKKMVDQRTWKEFQDSKMLWWVNRFIHIFGWAIVVETDDSDNIIAAWPARVKFRGFDEKTEDEGFKGLSDFLAVNIEKLQDETYNRGESATHEESSR
jgi:hypothetical protein